MFKALALATVLMVGSPLNADELVLTEGDKQTIMSLDWRTTGTHKLPVSNSLFSASPKHRVVIGADARKLSNLLGQSVASSLEAITIGSKGNTFLIFNNEEGYISLEDWENIDPKQILSSIRNAMGKVNEESRKKGGEEVQIIGWIQEPILDKPTNTMYWTIEEVFGGRHQFHSIALKFSRHGFELFMADGYLLDYKLIRGELDEILKAHSFASGYKYSDYKKGDVVAGSICSLPMASFMISFL